VTTEFLYTLFSNISAPSVCWSVGDTLVRKASLYHILHFMKQPCYAQTGSELQQ